MHEFKDVNILLGKTLTTIENQDNEKLTFTTTNGEKYIMYHEQDCCESVRLEEVIGDIDDLIGSPLTMAEVVTNQGENPPMLG